MVKVKLFQNSLTFERPSDTSKLNVTPEEADKLINAFDGRWQKSEGGGLEMMINDLEKNDFDLLLSKGEEVFVPEGTPILGGNKKKKT